jgi:diguanylate cyclase (GGDEF)-like protein
MLGFEQLERLLERSAKSGNEGYPPYNIEQTSDYSYRITLAVAGFAEEDLAITVEDRQLVIRGRQRDDSEGRVFLHRGIAARQFQRMFVLADGVEVGEAVMENGLLHVDLDFFKEVNDTRGHAAGDAGLQHVARVLVESSRDVDVVARVGGDEFVLLINGTTEEEVLGRISQRIITEVETPVPIKDANCKVSASVGIAIYKGGSDIGVEQLMDDADIALYASKHGGRSTYTLYRPELRASGPLAVGS